MLTALYTCVFDRACVCMYLCVHVRERANVYECLLCDVCVCVCVWKQKNRFSRHCSWICQQGRRGSGFLTLSSNSFGTCVPIPPLLLWVAYKHTYSRTYTHIHTYMHKYVHPYIHSFMNVFIHTSIYLYIHTHIQTYPAAHTLLACVSTCVFTRVSMYVSKYFPLMLSCACVRPLTPSITFAVNC